MAFMLIGSILLTRNLQKVPGKRQVVLEMFVNFVNNFCKEHLGKHARTFAPWLGTLFIYIFISNLLGMIHIIPPTKDITVTATLALLSVLLIYGAQMRYHGLWGGIKKFAQPSIFVFPINVMEIAIRPLSLCMRLFGNILAGHIVIELVEHVAPFLVPIPLIVFFDLFDGTIQAIVFIFLTTIFLGEAIEEHEA